MTSTLYGVALYVLITACSSDTKPSFKSYKIEIKGMQFQPSTLSVKPGDTVVFVNNDIVVHNATEEQNKTWASPPLATGESYVLVVTQSANYLCTIHPVMKGKLVVE